MSDYAGWVRRAVEFTQGLTSLKKPLGEVTAQAAVAPTLTLREMEQLKSEVQKTLPQELCRFWLDGSRCCSCRYHIELNVALHQEADRLYGGVSFFEATELPEYIESCLEWAEIAVDDPNQALLWQSSIPFAALNNGDYLGVLVTDDEAK